MESLRLAEFLPYRLNRLNSEVSARFSKLYRGAYGLTIPEWRVLATLAELGTTTATVIGRHSAMHKTKVSRAVYALDERRWLTREDDADDRRVEHLTLTHEGYAVNRRLAAGMLAYEGQFLGELSEPERDALTTALDSLERVLGLDSPGEGRN